MKGAAFPANMAKKVGLNREKHSNSYGYSDLVQTSKSDVLENRSGTDCTIS